jgi:hypothetical protein
VLIFITIELLDFSRSGEFVDQMRFFRASSWLFYGGSITFADATRHLIASVEVVFDHRKLGKRWGT